MVCDDDGEEWVGVIDQRCRNVCHDQWHPDTLHTISGQWQPGKWMCQWDELMTMSYDDWINIREWHQSVGLWSPLQRMLSPTHTWYHQVRNANADVILKTFPPLGTNLSLPVSTGGKSCKWRHEIVGNFLCDHTSALLSGAKHCSTMYENEDNYFCHKNLFMIMVGYIWLIWWLIFVILNGELSCEQFRSCPK